MAMSRLMVLNGRQLEELPSGGEIVFPRRLLSRYSLIEWLEFEKAFTERANELGLDVEVTDEHFSGRVKVRWRPHEN